jgi:hypothetical protein
MPMGSCGASGAGSIGKRRKEDNIFVYAAEYKFVKI